MARTIPEVEPSINSAVSEAVLSSVAASPESHCVLCGAALELSVAGLSDTRFGVPGSYDVHHCTQCDLEQTFPRPSMFELKRLYETYYNFGGETGTRYTRWREHFFFSPLNRLWSALDGDISFYQQRGTGRLIDIGCNEGRGLQIYAGNGFQVEGLELNETAAAVARKSGFIVHACLLEDFVPAQLYKVVVLSNVLEHSLDPRQMLQDVHRILAPDGQVWISCPNSKSWLRRIFGRSWINWHIPFHIVHFSSLTLRRALEDAGYAQIQFRQITPALWFTQSLIAYLFATNNKKNRQLRNPFLTLSIMLLARFVLFPFLWLANKCGHGDCLLTVATKA